MEQFNLSNSIHVDHGINDKITVKIEGWVVQATAIKLAEFQQFLCIAPVPRSVRGNQSNLIPSLQVGFGWVFKALPRYEEGRWSQFLEVRPSNSDCNLNPDGTYSKPPPPIFDGKLKFKGLGSGRFKITALLDVNPTRFVHHYYNRREAGDPQLESHPLRRGTVHQEYNSEFVLDDVADNWIPYIRPHSRCLRPGHWQGRLARYMNAVLNLLQSEFDRAARTAFGAGTANIAGTPLANRLITETPIITLKTAETYIEFACDEPISTAERLGAFVDAFGSTSSSTTTRVPRLVMNSRCFTAQVATGERLKLYAKTNRRIRIEVEHRLNDDNGSILPRHQFTGVEACLAGIEALRVRARSLIEDFRLHVVASSPHVGWNPSPLEFIQSVNQHANETPAIAAHLVTLLAANQGIRVNGGHPLLPALRRLKAAGVLRYDRGRKKYFPAAQFVYAASFLGTCMNDTQRLGATFVRRRRSQSPPTA